jgi:hypothetical protein
MAHHKLSRRKLRGGEQHSDNRGLTLDDFLVAVADVRRRFKMTTPTFGLREMELFPGADDALGQIIEGTISRHGTEIYSRPHPLLADAAYTGGRIHHARREQALQRAIEVCLQTVVQLPPRYPRPPSVPKRLKSLAATLTRLAGTATILFGEPEVRQRIESHFAGELKSRERLLGEVGEMQWCAETLNALSSLKVIKSRLGSPNPQISLAMYFVGWIEASTGSKYYRNLTTLFEAAFQAAKIAAPKWVDRLAVEVNSQRRWRKKWIGSITSRPSRTSH